jgi:hypothetical protein
MASTVMVSEVTASRMTASELASALTMRGGSASSGSWFDTRPTASRTSEAATFRSTPSLNSIVTRLLPNDEDDDIDLTPETRATAPSMTPVSSRSIVSPAAPSKAVVTVTTARSTSGNSRTSTP